MTGMPAPMLVQLEREIDREIAADKRDLKRGLSMAGGSTATQGYDLEDEEDESDLSDAEDCRQYGPLPQIVTNDLKSLDEMVSAIIMCCCKIIVYFHSRLNKVQYVICWNRLDFLYFVTNHIQT